MHRSIALVSFGFLFATTACSKHSSNDADPAATIAPATASTVPSAPTIDAPPTSDPAIPDAGQVSANEAAILIAAANDVRDALVAKDMHRLAPLVHPARGVRFSPYAYVDKQSDVVLAASDLTSTFASGRKLKWGTWDGREAPISLSFKDYLAKFVVFPQLAKLPGHVNETRAAGNTVSNLEDSYPGDPYVEFYYDGTVDHMDWAALRLVFERVGDKPMLVAVIHDVWTI